MHYLFAEFKTNTILQIPKRFLFAEERALPVTLAPIQLAVTISFCFLWWLPSLILFNSLNECVAYCYDKIVRRFQK